MVPDPNKQEPQQRGLYSWTCVTCNAFGELYIVNEQPWIADPTKDPATLATLAHAQKSPNCPGQPVLSELEFDAYPPIPPPIPPFPSQ